jgi:signal peptidase I
MPVSALRELRRAAAGRKTRSARRIETGTEGPVSTSRWAWEWIRTFLLAFGAFLVIRTFLVEAFRIPTGSMESTLLVGDFLLVNKAVFGAAIPATTMRLPAYGDPVRGQVVVFEPPHVRGSTYVKRVAGAPGDTLHMIGKTLYLNGRPLDEPYVRHSDPHDIAAPGMAWQCGFAGARTPSQGCRPTRDTWGPVIVPAGHLFMLGDNRDDSEDSRYWGLVPAGSVRGRPLVIYYSFNTVSLRPAPWLSAIRWQRVGRRIH